jgi:hypothetical protein
MNIINTNTLYKKEGRKYVPVRAYWAEDERNDWMKAGTFRLTYAYKDGGRRFEYDVTPDTAGFAAAATLAKEAMIEAIHERSIATPNRTTPYTKKQLAIIKEFRQKMADAGGLLPPMWTNATSDEIAYAAIEAVKGYRP